MTDLSLVTLFIYFAAMLGIGFYAYRRAAQDVSGYMLGGRDLGPGVTALSAGASDMSGWLMMGLPGAIFVSGLSSAWIAVGLLLGAYLNYLIVAPRLRTFTEVANDSITLPDFFENRFLDKTHSLRLISAVVIVIFFTIYTSSGMAAGGKLFESAFGINYQWGLYITASVVIVYTLFGGFLAVSLTDFVQGCIIFIALILVPVIAFMEIGGAEEMQTLLKDVDKNLINFFEGTTIIGIISALAWGLGYFGQPHIIVRFMAIRDVNDMPVARRIGMGWMFFSVLGAMATGFTGLAYMIAKGKLISDPETIFIDLSHLLFHPLITGFLLAAILAAIMSTISSQLLVTSSSLAEDFYKVFLNREATAKQQVFVGKLSVFTVACIAIFLATDRSSSILELVSNAWAGFGAAFGPVVILSLYWKSMNIKGAVAGVCVGALTVIVWIYYPLENGKHLSDFIYEILPGFIFSFITIIVVSKMTGGAPDEIRSLFKKMLTSRAESA
jgi:SSS family solute:Na+ symporter/sodium/proline symporter